MRMIIASKFIVKPHMITRLAERFGDELEVTRKFRQKGNKKKFSRRAFNEIVIKACKKGELVIQFQTKAGRWIILLKVIKARIFNQTIYLIVNQRSQCQIITTCYTEEMVKQLLEKLVSGRKQRILAVDYQSSDLWQKIMEQDGDWISQTNEDELVYASENQETYIN